MKQRVAFGEKLGLPPTQAEILAKLRAPEDVQDFISRIPINFEPEGDTCLSVTEVLRQKRAHCIEAAMTAACALWMQGRKPLLMDLQAEDDSDHVIALFHHNDHWGAISKSNHVWLRWRDPVYRSLRELAMSYLHEYTYGEDKTLRAYSASFDLRRYDPKLWITNPDNCWDIGASLDASRHYSLISKEQARRLRPRDRLELKADQLLQYAGKSDVL